MNRESFFKLLFGEQVSTCFSSSIFGTNISNAPSPNDVFFSINEMHGDGRKDSNVTCFRNFLLESDTVPLEDQINHITSKVPVSTIVFSGGKSYHHIISLQDPVSREEYNTICRQLMGFIPEIDKATKNPSRFSRIPDATRADTGAVQKLIYVGHRVPNMELLKILPSPKPASIKTAVNGKGMIAVNIWNMVRSPDNSIEILGLSGRNAFFFWLGQRLKEVGADVDTKQEIVTRAYNSLKNNSNFTLQEARSAARI